MQSVKILGYEIFENGSVKGKRGKLLKLHRGSSGYVQLNTWTEAKQKVFLLHRILAKAFIPNPDNKPEVNHIDGDKTNNNLSNLEWVTRSENIRHGVALGLIPATWEGKSGKQHPSSKTVEQLDLMGNILAEWGSSREAARETGINYGTISNVLINRGKTAGGYKWRYKQ